MAIVSSRVLFVTTSPRTPAKMIPEIDLLIRNFRGAKWNPTTQREFMNILREEDFFGGIGANDPAFSARDRINRAPKALGFVTLDPVIELTPAGYKLITSRRKDEVFLRQMLKFQIPSPYHKPNDKAATFCVKPYLELLRLIRTLGTLKFDELVIFGMQLTDYKLFEVIVNKIENYRRLKAFNKGRYKEFKQQYFVNELCEIYKDNIDQGDTKTRESADTSVSNFLKTKAQNMRDYADACFRYLRATGLVNVSQAGKSLSIIPERYDDVDFILRNIDPQPFDFKNVKSFVNYLGNATTPLLLTDNKELLINKLIREFPNVSIPFNATVEELKDLLDDCIEFRKNNKIQTQIQEIKDYRKYDDIQNVYNQLRQYYDQPLMFEWNTWRAMTMLDGGRIYANLNFDDFGQPLSTAPGNSPDIICDYGDFLLSVEVTLSSGQRQYEMEGEPVSRHLGRLKTSSGKPCYCLFIAPIINDACVTHFFALQHLNLQMYGGTSNIVPLPLELFRRMIEISYRANYIPNPSHVRNFFEKAIVYANNSVNEREWFDKVMNMATDWLNPNLYTS